MFPGIFTPVIIAASLTALNTPPPLGSPGSLPPIQGGGRICLVEDSKTAAYAISQTLRMLGLKVEHFFEAREAFAALCSSQYDLLITDLTLKPGLEQGDDLIKMVRAARDEAVRRLPILVLTGDREGETLLRVFEAGANDHLAKSANTQELSARVNNLLRIKRTYDNLSQSQPIPTVQGLICLIEDSRTYAYVLQKFLKEQGYAVEHFTQAPAALEAIKTRPYDLILTDLRLEGDMDGDALTLAIRQLPDLGKQRLPIIVVTSDQEEATLLAVFAAGANDYLIKPVRNPELLARIRNLIQGKRDMERIQHTGEVSTQPTADAIAPVMSAPSDRARSIDQILPGTDRGTAAAVRRPQVTPPRVGLGARLGEQLGRAVTSYPWLFLLATILLAIGSSAGLQHIGFTDDYRVYFGESNPELRAFDSLENTYAKNYSALFALQAPQGTVFNKELLGAVEWLTDAAWKIPSSIRVDSITNFQHTRSEGDELIVQDLASGSAQMTDEALQKIAQIALAEPLLLNRLVSPSGRTTGINVSLQLAGQSANESQQIAEYCLQLVEQFKAKYPQIPIYLSGMVMQDAAFLEATLRDMESLYPIMLLFVVLLAGILLRSVTGVIAICLIIAAASLSAMGIFGWFGTALSTPSAAAPTIILTVAVGDSLHFLTSFFHLLRQGTAKREALIEAVRLNLAPVFLTTLTNAIGFLSMNYSDAPPLRDLGNIVAVGVAYALLYSMLFLPALMMVLPFKPPKKLHKQPWLERQLTSWAGFVIHRQKAILIGAMAVVPLISAGVALIVLDDNFTKYFDQSYRFRVETDFIRENLSGMDSIEYSLKTGEPGGINDPLYLNRVEQFALWYRKQPGVVHVSALTDIVKRLNANMHNNDPFYARVPEDRNSAAQYLLLYKLSLPRGLDLNNQINLDESASRFTVTLGNASNAQLLALEQSAYEWLQENAPTMMQVRGASPSLMFARISERNIDSMLNGNVVSLLLVSALMLIALRSVPLGLISLVPNVLPALLAFGIWGYFVGQVGLASAVVFAMTQGIVVDDSVHFMTHYVAAKRRRLTAEQAIHETFLHIGPSMLFTSVILAGGFLILASSGFTVNADMGLLTALTFGIALILDMLMLAPLVLWLESLRLSALLMPPQAEADQ